ncbi:hypothetical protein ACFQZE_04215 [Paenibacillus sp. GCM10027627]
MSRTLMMNNGKCKDLGKVLNLDPVPDNSAFTFTQNSYFVHMYTNKL